MTARIHVISLGGTIAMAPVSERGIAPVFDAEDIVGSVPQLDDIAMVSSESLLRVPSGDLSLDDVRRLAGRIQKVKDQGATGVVVTQGTDTIEEVAFALDLLHGDPFPVVVTGAMRSPSAPGADGPANLIAAVRVAADPGAHGRGVLVALNETIHAARNIVKGHTSRPDAFHSMGVGAVGAVAESVVHWYWATTARPPALHALGELAPVIIVPTWMGDDGALLRASLVMEPAGLIIDGFGAGHVPGPLAPLLGDVAQRMPVVLCSRVGAGHLYQRTYGFPGSESDLLGRGLLWGGNLPASKARVLVTLGLATGLTTGQLSEFIKTVVG